MRGHLQERRPGVWRITVSDGFNDAGQRRRITRTVRGSKRDAHRELTKLLRERDEGKLSDGRQTLGDYLAEDWLPAVAKTSKRGRPRTDDSCALRGRVPPHLRGDREGTAPGSPRRSRREGAGAVARKRPRASDGLGRSQGALAGPRTGGGARARQELGRSVDRIPPGRRQAHVHDDRPSTRLAAPRRRRRDRPVGCRRAPCAWAGPQARGNPRPKVGRRLRHGQDPPNAHLGGREVPHRPAEVGGGRA